MTVQNEVDESPKIAIIGAGPCGLTAAKNMLQQGLTRITVFERNSHLGGNWIYGEHNEHSSVYETTHLISSNHMSKYEDYPMPAGYPDYPSHREMLTYFNGYADHFGLREVIRFNTKVIEVTRADNQQWHVVYSDERGQFDDYFDELLVANGHHWDPLLPSYPGEFNGIQLHSHDYKKSAPFQDQRVLVVGGGNSGCDIAVEVSRVAAKTWISLRSGQHVFPKFIFGKATDIAFSKINWLPNWCKQRLIAAVIGLVQGKYSKYRLKKPLGKPLEVHPTVNSELLYFIRHGKIFPRDAIERFEGDVVHFVDGRQEAFDTIIYATGYQISFPFFKPDLIDFSQCSHIPLYRKMIHPEFPHLFFIGLFQPQGSIWPLADHQAKIAAGIIRGTLKRPKALLEKIAKETRRTRKHYRASSRHALEVDYQTFRKQLLKELKHSQ
ncbi:MAG: NAD(P)-binding domain-containing protein [Legionellales bacterium]|nr:NAD(P)-binding domain-containing protein [Legionellales bacterium]